MNRSTYSGIILVLLMALAFTTQAQLLPDYSVLLAGGKQTFPENVATFRTEGALHEEEVLEGVYYRFLQFYQIPDAGQRQAIREAGIELLQYIPNRTFIASLPTEIDADLLEALGVRSIQPILPTNKMASGLATLAAQPTVELLLHYFPDIPQERVRAYCAADGLEILAQNGQNDVLRVRIAGERLHQLASLPYLAYAEAAPEPGEPEDTRGRSLHRANTLDMNTPSGRKYTGEGINVLVRDDGIVGPHIDFQGRLVQDINNDNGTHGDGVAGIFGGAGNLDPNERGMAAGATIYVLNYEQDFLDNTLPLHQNEQVLVTNSSYSNGCNAGYTTITRTVDQQIYQNPTLMHVFSAGNSNNQECGYGAGDQWGNITGGHKQGKNVIATANLYASGLLVASSSRGPAHDGRIKPDISANGEQGSTDPNQSYQEFGGTSGASPGIAGVTAQLHQAYQELNGGETAESALLKAILLNTANDLSNPGPDFRFGWGHVNGLRAVRVLEENRYFSATIDQNQTGQHEIEIPANVRQAKIMTYWMDPPASPMTNKALINDLDTRLIDGNSNVYLPYVLDPTPNPALLNLPATTGVDHLNNVEQVSLFDPEPGAYTLEIEGYEVPTGPVKYYVVIEYIFDEIELTYPYGGEGLAPGASEVIHWDAYGNAGEFTLEYSVDGGGNWNFIANIPGDDRLFVWEVPDELSGQAYLRISRDGLSDSNDEAFSIISVPEDLAVTQACPDFLHFTWSEVEGATSYEVFLLGDRYMEPVGTTSDLFFDVPTLNGNPTLDHWLSVRALGDDGLQGQRAIAIRYNGGLGNCVLDNDAILAQINVPFISSITGCGSFASPVVVTVQNGGLTTQTNLQVGYQFDGNPPVIETIAGPLSPGESVEHQFAAGIQINSSGNYDFRTWVSTTADEAFFNDTIRQDLNALLYFGDGANVPFFEDFQGDIPPPFWLIENPDGALTWERRTVPGPTGQITRTMYVNNRNYPLNGQEDVLATVPIDLTDAGENTVLSFDLSYAPFSANTFDGLRVDLFTDCGNNFAGSIYFKEGSELATAPAQNDFYTPDGASDWRKEQISLAPYVGSGVVFRFVNISGQGNSLYIDNVNVEELTPAVAAFTANTTEICKGQFVFFQNQSTGDDLDYLWSFGAGTSPSMATSAGPHVVVYQQAGLHTAQLIASNGVGADTFQIEIEVGEAPLPDFNYEVINGIVIFENLTTGADSYDWDFGDGDNGDSENPAHIYSEPGEYTVTLSAANDCGDNSVTQTITIETVSAASDLPSAISTRLVPNPSDGSFVLHIDGLVDEELDLQLLDLTGRRLFSRQIDRPGANFRQSFDLRGQPTGLYLLQLRTEKAVRTLKLVIE